MNASVAIQVLPTVTDDEEVIRIVDAVKNCQLVAAKAGCPAMHTYVKISYKPEGKVLTIDKKVTKHHQE